MAKSDKKLTADQEAIRNAQNDARSKLPADTQKRIAMIYNLDVKLEDEKKAVKEAKDEVDAAGAMANLTKTYGLEKEAVTFLIKLRKKDPTLRARLLAQVFGYADDFGWFLRDLFDGDAVGVGSEAEAGDTAVFDQTGEGQRRGGAKAQPRTTEQMAESHTPAPTPGIPLAEAERLYEEYLVANPPKRGPVPKAVTEEKARLLAQIEQAKAAKPAADEEKPGEEPTQEQEMVEEPPVEVPEAKPGEITQALREGNAAGDAHIREMASRPTPPPAPDVKADAPTKKPKRGRKKAEPAPKAPPAAAAPTPPPPPPPPADDEEDEDQPGLPVHRPDAIGAAPASYRVG